MKFIKQVKLNKHKIYFNINSKYIINKNGLIFFGNPIFKDLNRIDEKNIKNYIHEISGVCICVIFKKENIFIYTTLEATLEFILEKLKKNSSSQIISIIY